jgi:hypothetical protein
MAAAGRLGRRRSGWWWATIVAVSLRHFKLQILGFLYVSSGGCTTMKAKCTPNRLVWDFLEIEEDEQNRRTDRLDIAAMTTGCHTYTETHADGRTHGRTRQSLVVVASVFLLLAVASYKVWLSAQKGIDRMQQDIANVVKLETIKVQVKQPQFKQEAAVETVEFLDDSALVQALITRTLPSGHMNIQRKVLFLAQTPNGWQRTEPLAAFWNEPQTLDTPSLHFIFRRRDQTAVEQLAPGAEALYAALARATGQTLAGPDGRLTVQIAAEHISPDEEFIDGHMRVTSPLLFDLSFDYTAEELLAHLVRRSIAMRMLDAALRQTAVKPQWQRMVQGMQFWLVFSDALPLAPAAEQAGNRRLGRPNSTLQLTDLLGCHGGITLNSDRACTASLPWFSEDQQQLSAAAASLIDVIVARHGLDVMPALLQGFRRHEEWETLAPAVLGVSAADVEVAWQGAFVKDP